jgi:cobalt-zinc-cadmium efflux system membrane fusion protein
MSKRALIIILLLLAVAGGYYVMRDSTPENPAKEEHAAEDGHGHKEGKEEGHKEGEREEKGHGAGEEEFERGPNNGRMLKKDDFAVEITIFEKGVPPQFRIYAYDDGKPLNPSEVQLAIELSRLGGEVNQFTFTPEDNFLAGSGVVEEPHSFDVKVKAVHDGKTYEWAFESYEGRTKISKEASDAAGVKIEEAVSASIHETIKLTGRTTLNQNTTAQVKARFPGIVREVKKGPGESVNSGDVLAMVESNESLQVYPVKSPISGVILARNTNVGDVAGDAPMFTITDTSDVWAEFHIFPRDIDRIKTGQKVMITSFEGGHTGEAPITTMLPIAEASSQTVVARVTLPNPEGLWRAGMTVRGDVVIAERQVPVAVKTAAIQRMEGKTAVFVQEGENYEMQPIRTGASDSMWTEVLEGLQPGARYVSEKSFQIKADIGKSGASHDH